MVKTSDKTAPPPTIKEIRRSLPVQLTSDERLKIGSDLGKETQELLRAEGRKKEVGAQLTADVELHKASVARLGTLLANGYEYREVKCKLTIDRERDLATIVRDDTGEVVERRPLTPSEMQGELEL